MFTDVAGVARSFDDEAEEIRAFILDRFARLAAPFSPGEVLERPNFEDPDAPPFRYVEARSVRARLNEVLGPDCWESEVILSADMTAAVCHLKLHLPDGRTLRRSGVGTVARCGNREIEVKGAA